LELIPRRRMEHRGAVFEEMDTEAILRRSPEVCVVDELPHTNVPGSEREKRWQDVWVLLEHGIDVLTTINIQHLESLNDQISHITGIRVRETIPDWVMKQADEVVMVDLTPGALLNRLRRGVVYAPDKAERALENFFREPVLVALREMALRQTAHEVDVRQPVADGAGPGFAAGAASEEVVGRRQTERLLLHITSDPAAAALIRRGRRVADYLQADCIAVAVERSAGLESLSSEDRERLNKHLEFARNLHIDTRVLEGEDSASTLVEFARANKVTQIFLARPHRTTWTAVLGRSLVERVVRLATEMRVTVVADRGVRRERGVRNP
jgi:two-component system sensor histidine kinase KdpD